MAERRQDMANKGDEEWLCETWESSRYNREGRRWQPSTGSTTDVTLLWPRSQPASTLSLLLGHLVHISVINNRDNMFTAESSRETEHSQLINRSSTVLPRQYVQYAFMQSQNFQGRTSGCLCGRWVLQRGFVTWVDGLTHFVRTTTSCTRLQKTWA